MQTNRLQQGERVRGGITSSKGQEVITSSKGKKQEARNKKQEARSKKQEARKQQEEQENEEDEEEEDPSFTSSRFRKWRLALWASLELVSSRFRKWR